MEDFTFFILFLVGALTIAFVGWNAIIADIETSCMEDCSFTNGEFIRSMPGGQHENQCICEIGGEVRNIW